MLDSWCWGMNRVEHPKVSTYTIDLTILEGTMSERQRSAANPGLGVKADDLGQ